VLLTCDETNEASIRVIERNGARCGRQRPSMRTDL
jgi:predicted acetyltransferase